MSKEEFKNMDNFEKSEFINDNLRQGMSFKDIYSATLNNHELIKSREALLSQFKKAGYRIGEKQQNNHVLDDIASPPAQGSIDNPSLNIAGDDKALALLQQSDQILLMLEWWKKNLPQSQNSKTDKLNQAIPRNGEEIRKTIRISNLVWEKWKVFCRQNPGYSEKDLFAKALLFYMEEQ